jgi:hypothetical protein
MTREARLMCGIILITVRQWSAKQGDDLTVLVCDYIGGPISTGGVQLDT